MKKLLSERTLVKYGAIIFMIFIITPIVVFLTHRFLLSYFSVSIVSILIGMIAILVIAISILSVLFCKIKNMFIKAAFYCLIIIFEMLLLSLAFLFVINKDIWTAIKIFMISTVGISLITCVIMIKKNQNDNDLQFFKAVTDLISTGVTAWLLFDNVLSKLFNVSISLYDVFTPAFFYPVTFSFKLWESWIRYKNFNSNTKQ